MACLQGTHQGVVSCRLEAVLYSLAAVSKELVQLRQPCAADLQAACAWASAACDKPAAPAASTVRSQ